MFNLLRSVVADYLMATFIVLRIERCSVTAHGTTPRGTARMRKAIPFVLIAILATFVLHPASIPVPASSFLAGALAIAVYVGLQAILLNDLIDVDGTRDPVEATDRNASILGTEVA